VDGQQCSYRRRPVGLLAALLSTQRGFETWVFDRAVERPEAGRRGAARRPVPLRLLAGVATSTDVLDAPATTAVAGGERQAVRTASPA
jgi:hypothetical protein